MLALVFAHCLISSRPDAQRSVDMEALRTVAAEVAASARVSISGSIPGAGANSTGSELHVPGGTRNFYPAFWIRDAAMMLGEDFIPASEVEGWLKVVASVQPGDSGLSFPHGLKIPPYSIPDHITLQGAACWFPGAYADQGVGDFGYLPPADDAYYFIEMAHEAVRKGGGPKLLMKKFPTPWGEQPLHQICLKAFDSVAVDSKSQLVVCSDQPRQGRVDWGFCDSITKTGLCLMPSLLRWQAADRIAQFARQLGDRGVAGRMTGVCHQIQDSIRNVLLKAVSSDEAMLLSSTGIGAKDDIWASAFAVWLGILPRQQERQVQRHLLRLVQSGGIVAQGQVRQLPVAGNWGGSWEQAKSAPGTYQNGGYWATPTGWLVAALNKIDRSAANNLLHEYVEFVRQYRSKGAPFEWVNPATGVQSNANYASSAVLVYISLKQAGFR